MSILTNSTPQFGTAEYGSQSGSERCKTCNQPLGARYYRVNGVLTCESCAERVKAQTPEDCHSALMRGVLFGIGGALIGLTLYSAVGIITGLEIGYVSLAVGYIVGTAVMKGSRGIGGRRYQVTAVLLTYAAVSMAAIPIGISQIIKHREAKKASVTRPAVGGAQTAPLAQDESAADDLEQPVDSEPADAAKKSFAAAVGMLAFAGLASPFLGLTDDPVHGGIGVIILMVGIRIGWKLTDEKPVDIVGPFNNSAPAPSDASAG